MGKIADEVRPNSEHAHRDQRPEISLLGLFSYDKLSTPGRLAPGGPFIGENPGK